MHFQLLCVGNRNVSEDKNKLIGITRAQEKEGKIKKLITSDVHSTGRNKIVSWKDLADEEYTQ